MENVRLSKIERLLQKELSEIFRRQTQLSHGILVSVTTVRVSADLSIARAYLSIFPSEKSEEILQAVRQNARTIRYELGREVRMQLRKIPELSFFIDDSLDYIDKIDKLLNN
jgi:ribosome-binding factor A